MFSLRLCKETISNKRARGGDSISLAGGTSATPSNTTQDETGHDAMVVDTEVCFGALYPVYGLLLHGKKSDGKKEVSLTPSYDGNYGHFDVKPRPGYFAVLGENLEEFAVIDSATSRNLRTLDTENGIRMGAVLSCQTLSKRPKGNSGRQNLRFTLSINIYGKPASASSVGKSLALVSAFLQHPFAVQPGISYENPQFFKPPGAKIDMNDYVGDDESFSSRKAKLTSEMGSFLDSLESSDDATMSYTTDGLVTELENHQIIGVQFILQREEKKFVGDFAQSTRMPYGTSGPDDVTAFGGIIADAMGLGKTLTMLTAILSSLRKAVFFGDFAEGFDEATDTMPRTRATLVIVPSSQLLDVWSTEIKLHFAEAALSSIVFHGQTRTQEAETLRQHDIVLTTYATVMSDQKSNRTLYKLSWYRIVLDEAHWIRNPLSKQFRSVASLAGQIRWCITGTPIQNRLDDLISLTEFLRLPPFESRRQFNALVFTPLSTGTLDPGKALRTYLQMFCLRRRETNLCLPPSKIEHVELDLSEPELESCTQILYQAKRDMDAIVSRMNSINKYNILFTAIHRLRRICSLGTPASSASGEPLGLDQDTKDYGCEVCLGTNTDTKSLLGSLNFCPECSRSLQSSTPLPVSDHLPSAETVAPNLTRSSIPSPLVESQQDSMDHPPLSLRSTKLAAVLKTIAQDEQHAKHIVFSYWTATLDVLAEYLDAATYSRIDGRVSYSERRARLKGFQIDPSISILLMSIETGAVGLTLTAANRVHIVEPQWNPAVEEQAIARAVRKGQTREVIVYRYIMKGTVEQNIVSLQRQKKHLTRTALDSTDNDTLDEKFTELKFVLAM